MERLSLLFAVMLGATAQAQNLVPNASFEDYSSCPTYFGQWYEVLDWSSPYTASADYFNGCAQNTICGVPLNQFGYQTPSQGDGYMGLATFSYNDPDYREIILAELTQPLTIGVPVSMAMDVTCGGWGSLSQNSARWKARGPGMKFFVNPPVDWSTYLYPNGAPLHMDTVLADTTSWTRLTGTFVPDSAYRFVAITNFFEDSLSWPSVQEGAGFLGGSYAFVDNLCVSPDPQVCFSAQSMSIVHAEPVRYSLNAENGEIMLSTNHPFDRNSELLILDATGRFVRGEIWPAGAFSCTFNGAGFSAGMYTLTMPEAHVVLKFVCGAN